MNLRLWNGIAAVVHWIQFAVLLMLTTARDWPINFTRYGYDFEVMGIRPVSIFGLDLPLTSLVVAFIGATAVAHTLIVTVLWDDYRRYISQGMNPFRWLEYSITASIMIVIIAMSAGIWDAGTLIALFGLTSVMNLMGLVMETTTDRIDLERMQITQVDWTPYWIGVIAGIIPWIVIGISIFTTIDYAQGQMPDWVIWAFVSIFIFFNSFSLNMWLQYKMIGPWKNYEFGEWMYIILSLTSKSALAWQVWFGIQQTPII